MQVLSDDNVRLRIKLSYVEVWNISDQFDVSSSSRETLTAFLQYRQHALTRIHFHYAHLLTSVFAQWCCQGLKVQGQGLKARGQGLVNCPRGQGLKARGQGLKAQGQGLVNCPRGQGLKARGQGLSSGTTTLGYIEEWLTY